MDRLLSPKEGYDLAAPWYDTWYWTKFWKHNELPLVRMLLDRFTSCDALDAGSGTGAYRFQLESQGCNTVAIDISRRMLEVQEKKQRIISPHTTVRLIAGDLRAMPAEWSETFDFVICARVLAHIDECVLAIRELSRVLKKGGRLIITDIDPKHQYTCVRIRNGSIHSLIQIFKHDHQILASAFTASRLRIQMFRQFFLHDLLWLPPKDKFAKIYDNPRNPIFFIYDLTKEC
jgi:ubiquinone/menaquinone biosynthesis C-methylase UbiE